MLFVAVLERFVLRAGMLFKEWVDEKQEEKRGRNRRMRNIRRSRRRGKERNRRSSRNGRSRGRTRSRLRRRRRWRTIMKSRRRKDMVRKIRIIFPLTPMGVLAPGSAHGRPSAQPPIDMSGNFPAHVSAESPSKFSKKTLKNLKIAPRGPGGGGSNFIFF